MARKKKKKNQRGINSSSKCSEARASTAKKAAAAVVDQSSISNYAYWPSSSTSPMNNPMTELNPNIIQEREEVGFLFMKEQSIIFHIPHRKNDTISEAVPTAAVDSAQSPCYTPQKLPPCCSVSGKWIDVNLCKNHVAMVQDNIESESDVNIEDECAKKMKVSSSTEDLKPTKIASKIPASTCLHDKDGTPSQGLIDAAEHPKKSKPNVASVPSLPSTRGDLILQIDTTEDTIEWHEKNMETFSGIISDMSFNRLSTTIHTASSKSNDQTSNAPTATRQQRSDCSLLMGAVLACMNLGIVRMERFQLLVTDWIGPVQSTIDGGTLVKAEDVWNDQGRFYEVKVSLVVTISLPFLEQCSRAMYYDNVNSEEFEEGRTTGLSMQGRRVSMDASSTTNASTSTRKRSRKSFESSKTFQKSLSKPYNASALSLRGSKMHPVAQLLFSMLRSDWRNLNPDMIQLSSLCKNPSTEQIRRRTRRVSLEESPSIEARKAVFPTEISLEELYSRIQSAAKHERKEALKSLEKKRSGHGAYLKRLPDVILQEYIGPFLRAKSLHSLRLTCHHMHAVLQANVPGMKLRLFRHQVKSLRWMRHREERAYTEAQALAYFERQTKNGTKMEHSHTTGLSADRTLNGDMYRSVSCGSIISVTPKRNLVRDDWMVLGNKDKTASTVSACGSNVVSHDDNKVGHLPVWHINTVTGAASQIDQDQGAITVAQTSHVARGGLLCDDPGLGKTITVLSCILQTFGLSTEKAIDAKDHNANEGEKLKRQHKDYREDVLVNFWRGGLQSYSRHSEAIALLKEVREEDRYGLFELLLPESEDHKIQNPICMRKIIEKSNKDKYFDNFGDLFEDVELCYRNGIQFYSDEKSNESLELQLAKKLLQKFRTISIPSFKQKLYMSATRKSMSRKVIDSDNSIGALLQEKIKRDVLDAVIPSTATLLVVPHVLLKHWEEQIKMHVDFKYCTSKIPLLYRHSSKKRRKDNEVFANNGIHETRNADQVEELCRDAFCPLIMIDEGGSTPLPTPSFLAMFRVVITSSKRLTQEWKNGSIEEELRQTTNTNLGGIAQSYKRFNYEKSANSTECCPLLKVHWLRLVVDEGHSMGKHSHNNSIQFASWITSERRWAMTGTPTPQTISSSGVKNLFGLLKFLKHDYFSSRRGGDARYKELTKAFNEGQLSVFFQLSSLLNLFMVRHTKIDIEELEKLKPQFVVTHTNMSHEEKLAYNTLVSAVQMNIVTTSMISKTSGLQDSLLHVSQYKFAQLALNNIRLSCCGGTKVCPAISSTAKRETMEMLGKLNVDPIKKKLSSDYIDRVNTEQLSGCMKCGFQLQTLFILPCACIICTECLTAQATSCPSCDMKFAPDMFQKLQPGTVYDWKWNVEEMKSSKKVADAQILETLRHMALRGRQHIVPVIDPNPNDNEDLSRNPLDMINNEEIQRASQLSKSNRRKGHHRCCFPNQFIDGTCLICKTECDQCILINSERKCHICNRLAEDPPQEESKSYYMTTKLLELLTSTRHAVKKQWSLSNPGRPFDAPDTPDTHPNVRPLKAIVFSQFRQILNVVGDRLIRRFGYGCVAEYWGSARNNELDKFINVPKCFCMLLGKDGSHGLDLSFVSHIFFLDEIMDKSLESQVVARAYRMGATGPVKVEQLVARDSIEELIVELNCRSENNSANKMYENDGNVQAAGTYGGSPVNQKRLSAKEKSDQQAKVRFLLSKVHLMRNVGGPCHSLNKTRRQKGILRFKNEVEEGQKRKHKRQKVVFHEDDESIKDQPEDGSNANNTLDENDKKVAFIDANCSTYDNYHDHQVSSTLDIETNKPMKPKS